MFTVKKEDNPEENYRLMLEVIKAMLADEKNVIANLSNISAVINAYMDRLNWAGFYLMTDGELVLGPFQGMPACVRIKLGKGVCGTAALEKRVVLVEDVHAFSGHIACDSNTNSEIVVPIFKNGDIYGVLDLDSPDLKRFTELENRYLSKIGDAISEFLSKSE